MKVSKSAIFLFELMVVILVFSIAAAICTSIFAKGYQFSSESQNLTRAIINAESAAEEFKVSTQKTTESEVFFDDNWKQTDDKDNAAFTMKLSPSTEGNLNLCTIDIVNMDNDESIYTIETARYQNSNAGAN